MIETQKRKVARWIFIAFVIGVVLLGIAGYFVYRHVPFLSDVPDASARLEADAEAAKAAGVPFTAADMSPKPPVKDSENAATIFNQIVEKYGDKLGNDISSPRISANMTTSLSQGDVASVRLELKGIEQMLTLAHEAASRPGIDFKHDWDLGPNLSLPELGQVKSIIRFLAVRAEVRAFDGDHVGAISDLKAADNLGVLIGRDQILIALLVRCAISAITMKSFETCLNFAKREEDLQLYLAYVKSPLEPYDLVGCMKGEAYMGIATIRNFNEFGGFRGLSASSAGETPSKKIDPSKLIRDGLPKGTMERAFMARHLELFAEIFEKAPPTANDPDAFFNVVDDATNKFVNKDEPSYVLERILAPIYAQAGGAVVRAETNRNLQQQLVQALIYRSQRGAFPTKLEDAGKVPIDPFSGEPIKYMKTAQGIRTYSVGRDKSDDHGVTRSEVHGPDKNFDEVAIFPSKFAEQMRGLIPARK